MASAVTDTHTHIHKMTTITLTHAPRVKYVVGSEYSYTMEGRSQDFRKGGAQLDGVVIRSPQQSRTWPVLLAIGGGVRERNVPLPPKAEAFGILAEQLPNFY